MATPAGGRRELIEYFAQTAYDDTEILQHDEIVFKKEMKTVPAIVLPSPKALYGGM